MMILTQIFKVTNYRNFKGIIKNLVCPSKKYQYGIDIYQLVLQQEQVKFCLAQMIHQEYIRQLFSFYWFFEQISYWPIKKDAFIIKGGRVLVYYTPVFYSTRLVHRLLKEASTQNTVYIKISINFELLSCLHCSWLILLCNSYCTHLHLIRSLCKKCMQCWVASSRMHRCRLCRLPFVICLMIICNIPYKL